MPTDNSGEQLCAVAEELIDPAGSGVVRAGKLIGAVLLGECQAELREPACVAWRDSHSTYENQRGLTIVQNHDVYALKLTQGDQSPLERIPNLVAAARQAREFVHTLAHVLPSLVGWQPDELSLHRYDDPEVGLSFHKDNLRFTRLIAILSLEGICSLAVILGDNEVRYRTEPGDLVLVRGPGLTDDDRDLRPEHAVVDLETPTRVSMMLRENSRPDERIPGFEFDNW